MLSNLIIKEFAVSVVFVLNDDRSVQIQAGLPAGRAVAERQLTNIKPDVSNVTISVRMRK